MIRKYAWFAVVCVAVAAGMFTIAPRKDWLATGFGLVALLLLVGALMIPAVRQAAIGHRRGTMVVGASAVGVAVCVLVAGIFLAPLFSVELTAGAFSILLLAGLLLIRLPRISADMDGVIAAQRAVNALETSPQRSRPLIEVRRTLAEIFERKPALARVVGPWFLAFCVLPLVFADIDFWKGVLERHRELASILIIGLIVVILAQMALMMVAAIQWTRFIATGREPSWSEFPGKALWRFFWRWLIFGAIFRMTDRIEPWLRAHLPDLTSWGSQGLSQFIVFLILVLASPFALGLPAIALDAPGGSEVARTKAFRVVGRQYYGEAAILLAPYFVISWAIDLISLSYKGAEAQVVCVIVDVVALFVMVIVGATHVTRAYLKGTAIDGAGAAITTAVT